MKIHPGVRVVEGKKDQVPNEKATMAEYVPLSELNVDEVINLLENWGLSKDMGAE